MDIQECLSSDSKVGGRSFDLLASKCGFGECRPCLGMLPGHSQPSNLQLSNSSYPDVILVSEPFDCVSKCASPKSLTACTLASWRRRHTVLVCTSRLMLAKASSNSVGARR